MRGKATEDRATRTGSRLREPVQTILAAMERIHVDLRISGTVQGVWYRRSAVDEALRLGVTGFARNEPDGTVRVEAEGTRAAIDRFIVWCRIGPSRAQVEQVRISEGPVVGFADFVTRR